MQFAYQENVGVEDRCTFSTRPTLTWMKESIIVDIMFFNISSAFNTIQPLLLSEMFAKMQVDPHLVTWIADYFTGRPQYVKLRDCRSETVVSSTGIPQGTVPFALYPIHIGL